ncbi:hypothetical protein [Marinicella meishanensis]|uniref:hypothetical protein n=1 Tax=Marinicella meishanensis TaxID=2873263 RepID=UPI001CBCA616|nr:hypothetical protein [Marinicella sp. NBU2979]
MSNPYIEQLKSRNQANQQAKTIKKRIRYLQREWVRASFQGEEKMGLCHKIMKLIQQERHKINELQQ